MITPAHFVSIALNIYQLLPSESPSWVAEVQILGSSSAFQALWQGSGCKGSNQNSNWCSWGAGVTHSCLTKWTDILGVSPSFERHPTSWISLWRCFPFPLLPLLTWFLCTWFPASYFYIKLSKEPKGCSGNTSKNRMLTHDCITQVTALGCECISSLLFCLFLVVAG